MKLFENGVGRPSNEIKRKRKIFIASAIVICVALIAALGYALTKVDFNQLEGSGNTGVYATATTYSYTTTKKAYEKKADVRTSFKVTSIYGSGNTKQINIYVSGVGSEVKSTAFVVCMKKTDCTNDNAWDIMDKVDPQSTKKGSYAKGKNVALDLKTGSSSNANVTFYVKMTTYDSSNKRLYWSVYKFTSKSSPREGETKVYDMTNSAGVYIDSDYLASVKELTTTAPTTVKPLTLTCRASSLDTSTNAKVSETDCAVTSKGDAVSGYSVTINGQSIKAGTTIIGAALFTESGKSNYFKLRFYDNLYNNTAFTTTTNGNKFSTTATVQVTKSGYNAASDTIIVNGDIASGASNTLTLECPVSANSYEKFLCTTDQVGVKITVGGAKALDGTTSSFTTTASDMTKSIRYNNDLFNGQVVADIYIYTDSNGTYVNAKVTASKSEYTSVTKTVKIYQVDEPTSNSGGSNGGSNGNSNGGSNVVTTEETTEAKEEELTLSCPTTAKINTEFKCTTNLSGVKFSYSYTNQLAKGYPKEITKGVKLKYTKAGTRVYVKATKGEKSVQSVVKIYKDLDDYHVYYNIPAVKKSGSNGEKTVYINPYGLGEDVESYKFVVCKDRDTCMYDYENSDKVVETKLQTGMVVSHLAVNFATDDKNLLGSTFYIRTVVNLKDGNNYWKVHKIYVDLETNKTNRSDITDESKVKIGDTAAGTFDFLMSSKNKADMKAWDAYYNVSSIMKIDDGDNDRLVNVNLHNVGTNVKYVKFGLCDSKYDCKNISDSSYVEKNEDDLYVVTDFIKADSGTGIDLKAKLGTNDLLNEKIYISILTYNENQELLYHKVHSFKTATKTKNGVKKDKNIVNGDRAATVLSGVKYKKHFE